MCMLTLCNIVIMQGIVYSSLESLKPLDECCVIEVRRSHIVQDALKEAGKSKFCPRKVVSTCVHNNYTYTFWA